MKLIIERSLPKTGEPVMATLRDGADGRSRGEWLFEYDEWLQFNKVLREGQVALKAQGINKLDVLVVGQGMTLMKESKPAPAEPKPQSIQPKSLQADDAAIAALLATAQQEKGN